jgi:tetratricopeptide (TPR) repeat protein
LTKKILIILALAISLYFPVLTLAETIVLKSGKTVEGKLIEKTDKYIKIDFQGVPLTYFSDEIQSVDGVNIDEAEKRVNIQPAISKENTNTISNDKIYTQESYDSAYQKGASYLKQNKLDEAIGEFSKAIELNSRSDKAYYDRGRAYGAKGDLERALADYTQVININSPETIQSAYNNRGLIYEDKGDLDKALEDYTKGIEAMPNPMFSGFRYFKQVLIVIGHRYTYREKSSIKHWMMFKV